MSDQNVQQDEVDRLLKNAFYMEDVGAVELIARFLRINTHLERRLNEIFAFYGLDWGQSDVLGTLLRAGTDTPLTPTALANSLMCSSGAMTNRLDRLEKVELIERRSNPHDRRGTLIALTTKGREVIERATAARIANDIRLIPGLSMVEKQQLVELLRKVLVGFETEDSTADKK